VDLHCGPIVFGPAQPSCRGHVRDSGVSFCLNETQMKGKKGTPTSSLSPDSKSEAAFVVPLPCPTACCCCCLQLVIPPTSEAWHSSWFYMGLGSWGQPLQSAASLSLGNGSRGDFDENSSLPYWRRRLAVVCAAMHGYIYGWWL
jgi:hypothetical protein